MTDEEMYDEVIKSSKIALGQDVNNHEDDETIKKVLRVFDNMFYKEKNNDCQRAD